MKKTYHHYADPTREDFDGICVGDKVRINDWKKPMTVKGVSENFFVMTQNLFGEIYYSVCCKRPWEGKKYNKMIGGRAYTGPDFWVLGSPLTVKYPHLYHFDNEAAIAEYLQSLEKGECEVSERSGIAIYDLYVKNV